KPFPVFIHNTALDFEYIYVSAGQRGLQFKIAPADLIGYVKATVADLIQ
ncbi:MAG: Cys-tRNA(Pro) deacylase, partial [Muribaculaceae bacterium]